MNSHNERPSNIVLLGLPGSGKTTLGELMAEQDNTLEYISLGQISRDLPADDDRRIYVDNLYKEHNSPVGDASFFVELMRPHIKSAKERGKGVIIDGLPKKIDEVEPLNKLLEDEGVKLDGVVICEVSPFTALKRVLDRGEREGGLDNINTAINRGEVYWRVIDKIKGKLGGYLGVRIVTVDTDNMEPHDAASKACQALDDIKKREANANVNDIALDNDRLRLDAITLHKLHEAIISKNNDSAFKILNDILVDDKVNELFNAIGYQQDSQDAKSILLEYYTGDGEYKKMPRMAERQAELTLRTIYEPLKHLTSVIDKELALRCSDNDIYTLETIMTEIMTSKMIIGQMQGEANKVKSAEEYINRELVIRRNELKYVDQYLQENDTLTKGTTLHDLISMQLKYWNIFTSSVLIGSTDGNYQKNINSIPGSHHSLTPPITMPRKMIANSIGEYMPFIEAVSTNSRSGFDTSFGFLHAVGIDESGRAFQVEWPLLMTDKRLASHKNPLLRDMLKRGQEIYFNHDFWHNIVPVHADSFNLYHPHAPIAYGGLMENYLEFGKALRSEKEEYEILVARLHAEEQQLHMSQDETYIESQIGAALTILDDIPHLKKQLTISDSEKFANDVSQYFTIVTVGRILNIVEPDSPYLKPIIEKLNADDSLLITVERSHVLDLLLTQRMILCTKEERLSFMQQLTQSNIDESLKTHIIEELLANLNEVSKQPLFSPATANRVKQNNAVTEMLLNYTSHIPSYSESGASSVYRALNDMDLINKTIEDNNTATYLKGLDVLRWSAMISPQRNPLKGHMEKVHSKSKVIFGDKEIPAREVVKEQLLAIQKDISVYEYRKWAREYSQELSLMIYDILLNDDQERYKQERSILNILANYNSAAEGQLVSVECSIASLDQLLHNLIQADYNEDKSIITGIEQLKETAKHYSEELSNILKEIIDRYIFLSQQERAYQQFSNVNYRESKENLEKSTMNLLDKK